MTHTSAPIYLGSTADRHHIYAEIEIAEGDGRTRTFTNHETGPSPDRLSICFTATNRRGNPNTMADRYVISGGQIPAEDRVITSGAHEHLETIEKAWASSHLNDLNAACDHMTEEMLNPSEAELEIYLARNPGRGKYGKTSAIQSWRIDNVVCPETGYTWGHAWLVRTVDPELITQLRAIIDANL